MLIYHQTAASGLCGWAGGFLLTSVETKEKVDVDWEQLFVRKGQKFSSDLITSGLVRKQLFMRNLLQLNNRWTQRLFGSDVPGQLISL